MKKMQEDRNLLVFSGNAHKALADSICRELGVRPGKALVSTFSDGEVQVEIERTCAARKSSWSSRPVRRRRRT